MSMGYWTSLDKVSIYIEPEKAGMDWFELEEGTFIVCC
jgi:hypothetical protein